MPERHLVPILATIVGSMIGAAVFRIVAEWLFGLEVPDADSEGLEGAIESFFTVILWFMFMAIAAFMVLLFVPAGATALLLHLVEADRIAVTLIGGYVAFFVGSVVVGEAGLRMPPDAVMVASFIGSRVVVEVATRRRPAA